MPPVKSNNITGKEASHHRGKRANSRPKQKMGVVLTPFLFDSTYKTTTSSTRSRRVF